MSEERNRAVWPWFTGGTVGLPVLYAALLWPTCWLADREIISSAEIYRPLARLAALSPGKVRDAYSAYAGLGAKKPKAETVGHTMLLEEWRKCYPPVRVSRR